MKNRFIKHFNLLIILIFVSFFLKGSAYFQFAEAIVPAEYNRSGGNLTRENWNKLDEDFVKREGDLVSGNLSIDSNRVTNVETSFSQSGDIANANFVNNSISAAQGGDTFVNWGVTSCPAGSTELYDGIAFNAQYSYHAGSNNPVCLASGDAGSYFADPSNLSDALQPIITGDTIQLPSDFTRRRIIHCAVCIKAGSACFESIGDWDCASASGFEVQYEGYAGGMISYSTYPYRNPSDRFCLNRNMDQSLSRSTTNGAIWYGSKVVNAFGLSEYNPNLNTFTKCSVCCN